MKNLLKQCCCCVYGSKTHVSPSIQNIRKEKKSLICSIYLYARFKYFFHVVVCKCSNNALQCRKKIIIFFLFQSMKPNNNDYSFIPQYSCVLIFFLFIFFGSIRCCFLKCSVYLPSISFDVCFIPLYSLSSKQQQCIVALSSKTPICFHTLQLMYLDMFCFLCN